MPAKNTKCVDFPSASIQFDILPALNGKILRANPINQFLNRGH